MTFKAIADTAPVVAAVDRGDRAHALARSIVVRLGRGLVVPDTVAVEVDYFVRTRLRAASARLFLQSLADGALSVAFLTPGLLRRAAEIDEQYADLDLGFVDASVMAIAERHDLPILTFDYEHFRATRPAQGHWRLVVDEETFAAAVGR
ncbi:MAG TPA: PIN domain-containing protein [Gaiellaceae bacterium]|nr:PIN domain-containing protein [Gaiellaceae bacterium]